MMFYKLGVTLSKMSNKQFAQYLETHNSPFQRFQLINDQYQIWSNMINLIFEWIHGTHEIKYTDLLVLWLVLETRFSPNDQPRHSDFLLYVPSLMSSVVMRRSKVYNDLVKGTKIWNHNKDKDLLALESNSEPAGRSSIGYTRDFCFVLWFRHNLSHTHPKSMAAPTKLPSMPTIGRRHLESQSREKGKLNFTCIWQGKAWQLLCTLLKHVLMLFCAVNWKIQPFPEILPPFSSFF